MSPRSSSLNQLVSQVESRIVARKVSRGAAITLAAALVCMIAAALLASHVKGAALLMLLRLAPLPVAAITAWFAIFRPMRARVESARLARLIEEKCELNDRLV